MASLAAQLKRVACEAIDKNSGALHGLSRDIWSHPELNYEEKYSHDALTSFLETSAGFPNVERNYVVETGFRAEYGEAEKPHVVVICEYDALPEIGHACGHNLIAEVGVAAGIGIKAAIDEAKRDGSDLGRVSVLGTPAEEGGGGKVDMIKAGAFKSMDVAMMCHPAPVTVTALAALTAVQILGVKFFGKASHAAAFPWEGVNALDAAVTAYVNISTMRQQMKPTWRIHGVIVNGGTRPNIIPEVSQMEYYIRAPTLQELTILKAKASACFEAAAKATGCTVDLNWHPKPYLNLISNPTLGGLFENNAKALGVEFEADLSKCASLAGSTDMGNVSYELPSIHPMYEIGSTAINHTRDFTEAAGDAKAQSYTLVQGKALAMTAVDIFCQPGLIETMKEEHARQLAC